MTWEQAISILRRGSEAIEKKNRELERELLLKYKRSPIKSSRGSGNEFQVKRS